MATPERRQDRRESELEYHCGDPDFLKSAPPRIVELFRYWDEKRGARVMPRRRDIAPEDFRLHLPGVLLVDVEGIDDDGVGIYRYRVVGTREVRLRGRDPTGRLVQNGFYGSSAEDVIAAYEKVRLERKLSYATHERRTTDGKWQQGVTLFLPLSEDGESVTQILVYAESISPSQGSDLSGRSALTQRPGTGRRRLPTS